jgi:hypothetical protein
VTVFLGLMDIPDLKNPESFQAASALTQEVAVSSAVRLLASLTGSPIPLDCDYPYAEAASPEYKPLIAYAATSGLLNGCGFDSFSPKASASREQAIALLNNVVKASIAAVPTRVVDNPVEKSRLSYINGADRIATAVAISRQGWTSSDTVVVTSSNDNNLVDALAVAPLAGQEGAPILLAKNDS